jgi:Flp pilus assembly protein TadD
MTVLFISWLFMNTHHFQHATALFYEADYQSALRAINIYLELKPRSSMGFNNRALIHLHMGESATAREDMRTSIMLNHLNYVAYFNLFSV